MKMKLSALILDPSAQPRVKLDSEAITEYAEAMQEGYSFPPVVAYGTERRAFVADGWHRYHAAQAAGLSEIEVDLKPGELADAVWYSVSTNTKHGLRRSNADKNRAVTTALTINPSLADAEIARICAVHHSTVASIRKNLERSGAIEAVEVRHGMRGGSPVKHVVKTPSEAPKTAPQVEEPLPPYEATDEPVTSTEEAPEIDNTESERVGTVIAPPRVVTEPAQKPIDEERAANALMGIRYRRLALFSPLNAAKWLAGGADPLTPDEMRDIGNWYLEVADEMAMRRHR